ncbi:MAG: hypothetical protein QME60_05455 [Verrucomicrobiota bacterium]|nr:hypothetical protein [Verrucomicrobiota bacterium]
MRGRFRDRTRRKEIIILPMLAGQRYSDWLGLFCLGMFAVGAQILFVREMMVAFFGNELIIGTILAAWLLGIGLGALAARWWVERLASPVKTQWFLFLILLGLSVCLPIQLAAVRCVRMILSIPPGEYAPFGSSAAGALIILFPTGAGIGVFFPVACRRLLLEPGQKESPVSFVYSVESLGSLAGGLVMTFLLLPLLSAWQVVLVVVSVGSVGAAAMAPRRAGLALVGLLAIGGVAAALAHPAWLKSLEARLDRVRWQGFGALDAPGVRLVQSRDSVYQNLSVTENAGQFALYGNGHVLFVFPDPLGDEHAIHFIMAQKPNAKRVLMLGGNPVGEIAEALKYPLERLVHVDLDPTVGSMVKEALPAEYAAIAGDPRVSFVTGDAIAFVRRCREVFDVIIAQTPEPSTAAAGRFYTVEFYRQLKAILADGGFVATAVSTSERLQGEAVNMGATVYATLKEVFPVVLVTAESTNRLLAGARGRAPAGAGPAESLDGLTFDRQVLVARSRQAGVRTLYFRPEYFLGADEIAPEKTKWVETLFAEADAPLNTSLRPVACFYNLLLWSRVSGSGLEQTLVWLEQISPWKIAVWLPAAGILGVALALVCRRRRDRFPGACRAVPRSAAATLILTTGFCGMALEIMFVFVFQSLYGYIYARLGAIVAAFMLGLAVGAPCGRVMSRGAFGPFCARLAGCELLLLAIALGVPFLMRGASAGGGEWPGLLECAIYAGVALTGWAVGAEFPLANRLFNDAGDRISSGAAVTDAADHLGAALGSLLMGVVLAPVLGIGASCGVLAALKLAGMLFVGSAFLSGTTPLATRPRAVIRD